MFEELLGKIARSLEKNKLPYMVIGGQAVLLYGEPRLTRDIDITLGCDTTWLDELMRAIQGIPLESLPEDIKSFVTQTMVLPTVEKDSGIRVDFIFSFTPYEREAIKRAKAIKIGGSKVKFAAPEDIVIHKIFAGRPRDLEDIEIILKKNPEIDTGYIKSWLKKFDDSSEEPKFLSIFTSLLKSVKITAKSLP